MWRKICQQFAKIRKGFQAFRRDSNSFPENKIMFSENTKMKCTDGIISRQMSSSSYDKSAEAQATQKSICNTVSHKTEKEKV